MATPFDPSLRMRPTGILSVGGSNVGDYETVSWSWEPAARASTASNQPEYEIIYSPADINRAPIGRVLIPNYEAQAAAENEDGELTIAFEVLQLKGALIDVLAAPTSTNKGEVRTWPVAFSGRSYYGPRLSVSFPRVELRPDGEVVIGRNSNQLSTIRFIGRVVPEGDGPNRFGTVDASSGGGGSNIMLRHPRVTIPVPDRTMSVRQFGLVAGESMQMSHSRAATVPIGLFEADLDIPLFTYLARFSAARMSSDFMGNVTFILAANGDAQPVGSPQAGDTWSFVGSLADRLGIAGSHVAFEA